MNIKQLMLIMASFSLMPLGAAEQAPEASSSTETNTPHPIMDKAPLEYGTCTLEDKTTSGCPYPQPNTETFCQIQPLKNNPTIQAVTLFEGFTRGTSGSCKTGHDMCSPLCNGLKSSNHMRCGGYIANALDKKYREDAERLITQHYNIMDDQTHKLTTSVLHRFVTTKDDELSKHAQHGGAHGIVALIDTEKEILLPVNLGLRLMVIRDNKLLYVTEDQTILQRYANILFAKKQSALNALKKNGKLDINSTELHYVSVTIGDKKSERFTFGPHRQSSEFTTCLGDTFIHKYGADCQPNFNVYKNTGAALELCDDSRIKLENNDLIIMATNNFFGILKDTQEVINEHGHIKQDLTEANPIASLITSKLSAEPAIDVNDLAYYLAQEARKAGEPRSITVQVIRYKKTVTNPALNITTAPVVNSPINNPINVADETIKSEEVAAQIPENTKVIDDQTPEIATITTPVLKIKPAMSAPAAPYNLTPKRPIELVGNSDDDEEEIEEAVTINSIGAFDYGHATLDNSRPKSKYTNQDYATQEPLNETIHFIGVFDGHGEKEASAKSDPNGTLKSGGVIARWAAPAYLLTLRKQQLNRKCSFDDEDLHSTVAKNMQRFLTEKSLQDISQYSGTTACIALIDKENHKLISVNIGDSRLIIIRNQKCIFATEDQIVENEFDASTLTEIKNPNNNPFHEKLTNMKTCTLRINGVDHAFLYQTTQMLNGSTHEVMRLGGLMMTRSLGDVVAHTQGVIDTPDIETFDLKDGDIIVLATDGLWGNKDNNFVASYISQALNYNAQADLSGIAQNLAKIARGNGTNGAQQDDTTIQIVRYKKSSTTQTAPVQETTQLIVQVKDTTPIVNNPIDNVINVANETIIPIETVVAAQIPVTTDQTDDQAAPEILNEQQDPIAQTAPVATAQETTIAPTEIATNMQPDPTAQPAPVVTQPITAQNDGFVPVDDAQANPIIPNSANVTNTSGDQAATMEAPTPWLRIAADKANKAAAQVAGFVQEHPKLAAAATIGAGLTYYWAKVYNKKK